MGNKDNPKSPGAEEFERRDKVLEHLGSFAEGDFFEPDQKYIKRLVSATNNHLVYLDTEDSIQWSLYKADRSNTYNEICSAIVTLQAHSDALLRRRQRYHFNKSLASALASTLFGNDNEAKAQVVRAKDQLKDRVRLIYLFGSSVSAIVVAIVATVIWLYRGTIEPALTPDVFEVCLATCAGAVGALVSVILKGDHILISPDRRPYFIDGVSRILLGVLSAFFAAILIKTNLVAGLAADSRLGLIALSGLAGTLEYFVPHIVKTVGIDTADNQ